MIKKILVAQDGSEYAKAALDYGLWLAKSFQASLIGVHVVDVVSIEGPFLHDISASIGFEPFLNFSAKMREALEAKGKTILGVFEDACAKAGVECESRMAFGIVPNEICEGSLLSDLIVMGRHGVNERYEHGLFGSITEGVIRKSPKPVLIVPKAFHTPKNPLLAYDGSPSASKAMHSAAEWAKTLGFALTVVTVSIPETDGRVLKDAQSYLKPYGIKARFVNLAGDTPLEVEKFYRDNGHDLLFMGATHRSRMAELVLGSTAEHVMRAVEGPFFLER